MDSSLNCDDTVNNTSSPQNINGNIVQELPFSYTVSPFVISPTLAYSNVTTDRLRSEPDQSDDQGDIDNEDFLGIPSTSSGIGLQDDIDNGKWGSLIPSTSKFSLQSHIQDGDPLNQPSTSGLQGDIGDGDSLSKPSTSGLGFQGNNYDMDPFQDSGSSFHPSSDSESSVESNESESRQLRKRKRCLQGSEENCDREQSTSPNNIGPEVTPRKKKRAKKGESNPSSWKRNRQKILRMKGEQYVVEKKRGDGSKHEQIKKPREMKEIGCASKKCFKSKEKRLCSKITNDQRREIFNRFWSDLDWKQRKVFVSTLVSQQPIKEKKTTKAKSRRSSSLQYHLKIDNVLTPVCKQMFLSTLGIGEWTVHNWVKNAHSSGIAKSVEGFPLKAKPINATCRKKIVEFFEKLPKLPSHYCRSTTGKMYLETVFRLYSEVFQLYKKEVDPNFTTSINVFLNEMKKSNIDIFHPRKDQCDLCFSHKMGNLTDEVYEQHLAQKNRARAEKQRDKLDAISGKVCSITVDVQAVQLVPHVQAGMVYFKQKLACHNYTLYNLKTDKVVCYV